MVRMIPDNISVCCSECFQTELHYATLSTNMYAERQTRDNPLKGKATHSGKHRDTDILHILEF